VAGAIEATVSVLRSTVQSSFADDSAAKLLCTVDRSTDTVASIAPVAS